MEKDLAIRITAFNWLKEKTLIHGDVLPRSLLEEGFFFDEHRVPLVSPQGIFKPKVLDLPLSITTSPNSPYDDKLTDNGFLVYKYRGTDPNNRDNIILREAYKLKKPLMYFPGMTP